MPGKVFLDTNILVYAYDLDAGEKRDRARRVVAAFFLGCLDHRYRKGRRRSASLH